MNPNDKNLNELLEAWREIDDEGACPKCGCTESGWEYHDCYGTSADELADREATKKDIVNKMYKSGEKETEDE